jgi:hypothetical protein
VTAAKLALSLVVTFALTEAAFRSFLPQPVYAVELAPWGFWHIPNVCLIHGADPLAEGSHLRGTEYVTHVCYNAFGMRDRDRSLERVPDTKRILLLGDSYGEGMEVEYEQSFAQVLERSLNDGPAISGPVAPPAERAITGLAPTDREDWRATRSILATLRNDVARDGAAFALVNVHYTGADRAERFPFFAANGIPVIDVALQERAQLAIYNYRYDGHWNAAGNRRAAGLVDQALLEPGLLERRADQEVEVLNMAASAFSTCKELVLYEQLARRFRPDLVLLLYTATDGRNLADADMCAVDANGGVTVTPRHPGTLETAWRALRGRIRSSSHLATWVTDRLVELPFLSAIRTDPIQREERRYYLPGD